MPLPQLPGRFSLWFVGSRLSPAKQDKAGREWQRDTENVLDRARHSSVYPEVMPIFLALKENRNGFWPYCRHPGHVPPGRPREVHTETSKWHFVPLGGKRTL
jgi:hypothetical protein